MRSEAAAEWEIWAQEGGGGCREGRQAVKFCIKAVITENSWKSPRAALGTT